jgi:hypothetical protein
VVAGYLAALVVAAAILVKPFARTAGRAVAAEHERMVRAWIDGPAEVRRSRRLQVKG